MKYLFVLRGAPACGKSSFIEKHNLSGYTISPDTIRTQIGSVWWTLEGNKISQSSNKHMFEKYFFPMLEDRMRKGELIFVDATTSLLHEIKEYQKRCETYGYYMRIIDFTMVPEETCIERNQKRFPEYKRVPERVIHKMYERFRSETVPNNIIVIPYDKFDPSILNLNPQNFSKYDHVFLIGDIHGCFDALKNKVLPRVKPNSAIVFVGDYFDRGTQQDQMFQWIDEHLNEENYFFLIGNHEARIRHWLRTGKRQSGSFSDTVDRVRTTKKGWRRFYRGLWPILTFSFGAGTFVVTHGGLSDYRQTSKYTATYQFVHGIGEYGEVEAVGNAWDASVGDNLIFQVFGHRFYKEMLVGGHSFNLCGNPEMNGTIRWLNVSKQSDNTLEFTYGEDKTNFFDQESFVREFAERNELYNAKNEQYIDAFRKCKFVRERQTKMTHISNFNFTRDAFFKKNWDGITMRARGLFVNTFTNQIVARSYDKFFKLDEMPESSLETMQLNYKAPLYLFRKEDGYLCMIGYDAESDSLVYTSKTMIAGDNEDTSSHADFFKSYVNQATGFNEEKAKAFLEENNVTLVFEMVASTFDPHIIRYPKVRIVLLDIVKNDFNFKLFDDNNIENYMKRMDHVLDDLTDGHRGVFEVKKLIKVFDKIPSEQEIDALRNTNEKIEGYVLMDSEYHMVKIKTAYYDAKKQARNFFNLYVVEKKPMPDISFDEFKSKYQIFPDVYRTNLYEYYIWLKKNSFALDKNDDWNDIVSEFIL